MQASSRQIAKALMHSLEEGFDVARLAKSFEKYLSENHLMGLAPNIISNLEKELAEYEKERTAEITLSHEMKDSIVKDIEKRIDKDVSDKRVLTVDKDLIGGFKAVYKGKIFDGSIRNYLKELRETLAQ